MLKGILELVSYRLAEMSLFQFKNDTIVRFVEHYHRIGNQLHVTERIPVPSIWLGLLSQVITLEIMPCSRTKMPLTSP